MNTVVLEVRSLSATLAAAARAIKTRPRDREAHISFATPELLWQVLTAKRWGLLKAMGGVGPISMREAARRVDREVKAVHGEVTALIHSGVIQRTSDSQIECPFDAVKVEFVLQMV